MPSAAEHREKCERHRQFLAIVPDEFPDWLATVAFYIGVEAIEMMLAERGAHSRDHHERNQAVKRQFPSLNASWHTLYNMSLDVRYLTADHFPTIGEVRSQLIDRKLAHVLSFARAHSAEGKRLKA
ncbi:MAG: hypothetical protein K1X71_11450 [Pirellulales bacterium]|nr:hypothetical protein [Pirellulales bacterium]